MEKENVAMDIITESKLEHTAAYASTEMCDHVISLVTHYSLLTNPIFQLF